MNTLEDEQELANILPTVRTYISLNTVIPGIEAHGLDSSLGPFLSPWACM